MEWISPEREVCNAFREVEELYEYCISGRLYNLARGLVRGEIADAAHNPKDFMKSMGWSTEGLTPDVEECIDLELTYSRRDVIDVMKALGEEAAKLYKETGDLSEALDYAMVSDEVSDTLSNVVAKRLLQALAICR